MCRFLNEIYGGADILCEHLAAISMKMPDTEHLGSEIDHDVDAAHRDRFNGQIFFNQLDAIEVIVQVLSITACIVIHNRYAGAEIE